MKLILATGNLDKIAEIKALLGDLQVELIPIGNWDDFTLPEERGYSLEENAELKGMAAALHTGLPALADDTGLEVEVLDGFPGVYSARYAGENASYADNRALLLKTMSNIPDEERAATFRTIVALCLPNGMCRKVEGSCPGVITRHERGSAGFGYDSIFMVPIAGKTFSEMSAEEKNRISHRGHAFRKARALVESLLDRGILQSQNAT